MSIDDFNRIKREIASFADDELELVSDYQSGRLLFERNGQTIDVVVFEDEDEKKQVRINDAVLRYNTFLAKELAHLDVLASKMLQHSGQEDATYVDPSVSLLCMDKQQQGDALPMLSEECRQDALVGSKICFVTADAGHGKSMLLRQFQKKQAEKYLRGESKYLFWHIDLHGRDLVRLNEAIMYELGELRMSGLYYSSIITLLRRHLIVLGIDGFDELAAEKGGETALNSLSSLVMQLDGRGVLVAASRRAFFNSQDYVQRSGLLRKNISAGCVFDELKILNWRKPQCSQYLSQYTFDSDVYDGLVNVLKTVEHPLLERPYLFTKLVTYSFEDGISPVEFVTSRACGYDSINSIIESFVYREVDKWSAWDKTTGKPYLTFVQHIQILSEIAKEMWRSQRDYVTLESIQIFASILFDEWKLASDVRPIVLRLLESHAMLLNCENQDTCRRFDHEEFKNYFLSRALEKDLILATKTQNFLNISLMFSASPLSDSVAQYIATRIEKNNVIPIVSGVLLMHQKEWKPTYLQTNIGTLLPFLLNEVEHDNIVVDNKITFTSLVFENKMLCNVLFRDCSFVNVSFRNTRLNNVRFENCSFSSLKIYSTDGSLSFVNCTLDAQCKLTDLTYIYDNEEEREFAPYAILLRLSQLGIKSEGIVINDVDCVENNACETDFYRLVRRLLNKFTQSTCIYESNLRELPSMNARNPDVIINEVIPLFERYNIVMQKETKMSKRAGTRAWVLKDYDVSQILKAEYQSNHELASFWLEVKSHS